jgi:hypothetical protein
MTSRGVHLTSVIGMIAVALTLPAGMTAAAPVPTAEEILHRVLLTTAAFPAEASVDAEFRLRVKKSLSQPPDCIFRGTVKVVGRHPTLGVGERTAGLFCWAVNRYVLGRLFEASERLESFLARFEFEVLGEKLAGNDHYYLIEGKAKDPRNNPSKMIGWIDFDRGLLVEGTVEYSWGSIDTEQRYTRMESAWMLTYQYLHSARFDASMEIVYSNFSFGSQQ